jgi:DNA mismatch repair protein MutS
MAAAELGPMLERAAALAQVRGRLARACEPLLTPARAVLEMCVDEPPPHAREGGLIRDGVDAALDECRLLERDAGSWLAAYQGRLISEHNLPSLKVGFNRVFGYFIELPSAQAKTAPALLTRTQTLRNAERFTTPELRDFEKKVTSARANALERERELAAALTQDLAVHQGALAELADAVAELDVLCAFADKAHRRRWVRPEVVEAPVLRIVAGRHPVLDELLEGEFVPNDVMLGEASPGMALITGPNMAGKSTYIRQVALLTLLAHTGSFVPADEAVVGVVDRIFTRIGADDALHQGQSTFMVEMVETANILHHATSRSLVVLDEIGRGTSTLDGLSLAWAIAEHLSLGREQPRALFATHYHELTALEERFPGKVQNLQVLVREWPPGDEHASIVFLHRIEAGRADKSYGVQVARLAGIPAPVVARAREVLASLSVMQAGERAEGLGPEREPEPGESRRPRRGKARSEEQLGLFTEYVEHPALTLLREAKLETLSPIAAFDLLRSMRTQMDGDDAPTSNGKA